MFKLSTYQDDTTSTTPTSTWYLLPGSYILGRGPKCNISLGKNNTISRTHSTIRITKGNFNSKIKETYHHVELHDGMSKTKETWKHSASGTFVNDTQLGKDWVNIVDGDILRFSNLRFQVSACNFRIVTSKINGDNQSRLKKLAAQCGFHLVKSVVVDRATHLVMPESSATPKAVQALSSNIPIVSMSLFEDMLKLKEKMHPFNMNSERYRPQLASDALNMSGSSARFHHVVGRQHIFSNDIFLLEKTNKNSSWFCSFK